MDFIDACKVVLRHWYVVLPLLALTFAGTILAYASASAQYTARGSLVLVVPSAQPIPGKTNPTGGQLTTCDVNPWCAQNNAASLGNVTALRMSDPGVVKRLGQAHAGSTYTVALSADSRSPIIDMSVTAPTSEEALATLKSVKNEVEDQLRQRQLASPGVDANGLITVEAVTMSIHADVQSGAMLRAALAAFALGLAITLGGAFLFESIARTRRNTSSQLLERIAYPEGNGAPAKPEADTNRDSEGESAAGSRIPKPVPAAQRPSGRVGS